MAALGESIVISGHSHLIALVGDRYCEAPSIRTLEGQEGVEVLDGPWPRPDAYWRELAQRARGRRVGIMWGGNEHNSIYFFQAAYRFDFSSRYVARLLGRAQIVTQRTVKQRFRELTLDDLEAVLSIVSESKPERLALLGTPPPKKDSEKLRALLEREPVFVAWAASLKTDLKTIEITDPYVRLKLWFLLQDMLREAAERHGGHFVETPQEVQDEEGFLREEFWAPDVTHANSEYGRIMLAKVLRELNDTEASALSVGEGKVAGPTESAT